MTCCGLVFSEAHLLCVGCTLAGETLEHRGLVKLLTSAEFFHDTGSFEFSFEFLEGAFNVADICVTAGAALMFIYLIFIDKEFFRDKKKEEAEKAAAGAEENGEKDE